MKVINANNIENEFLYNYDKEAARLVRAIKNKEDSVVKIYLYLFSLIQLASKRDTRIFIEREWSGQEHSSLKDVYFNWLDIY